MSLRSVCFIHSIHSFARVFVHWFHKSIHTINISVAAPWYYRFLSDAYVSTCDFVCFRAPALALLCSSVSAYPVVVISWGSLLIGFGIFLFGKPHSLMMILAAAGVDATGVAGSIMGISVSLNMSASLRSRD